jgi:glutathione S-transferase
VKLYMHPVSMTSRPVRLFIAESGIKVDEQVVDLMTGEHYKEPFLAVNPNRMVPVLEDGDFRLTESSAILKYLADKINSPAYPRDLKQRAKVNEMMDWLNTQFYREYGYGFIYPQIFPNNKRPTDAAQKACLEWSKERAQNWLKILDQHWLGPRANYLCGDKITIADYLGAGFVSLGEIIRMDFAAYPNVKRWLENMKRLRSWNKVNDVFYGFREAVKYQQFVTL